MRIQGELYLLVKAVDGIVTIPDLRVSGNKCSSRNRLSPTGIGRSDSKRNDEDSNAEVGTHRHQPDTQRLLLFL